MFERPHHRGGSLRQRPSNQRLQHARSELKIHLIFHIRSVVAGGLKSPTLLKDFEHRIVAADINFIRPIQQGRCGKSLVKKTGAHGHVRPNSRVLAADYSGGHNPGHKLRKPFNVRNQIE